MKVDVAANTDAVDTSTALYRHFDADGVLLYVGISLSAVARLAQHRDNAHWYRAIARVDIEWLPTREDAIFAERRAIFRERPLHNLAVPKIDVDNSPIARWRARIAERRGKYTQRDAAAELGVSLPTFQALERGAAWADGKPRDDLRTMLACAAIEAGIEPIT